MKKMISLHKHWIAADAIKEVLFKQAGEEELKDIPEEMHKAAMMFSSFTRLSVLYGLLYVVVEGYNEIKGEDETIDKLLQKEGYADSLRRFRNATFHYQKDPVSEKLLHFLELKDSETWTQELHKAFRKYFERVLPIKETLEKIKA